MKENLLILGAGGHGSVVKEVAESMGIFKKIDFLDDNPDCEEAIGLCRDIVKFAGNYNYAFPAFGNNELRMMWFKKLEENNYNIPNLIHPTAYISPSATIESGTVIGAKAIVNTKSIIKNGCILSVGAIVDHDSLVANGCHIDCGAIVKANSVVNAFTKVESGTIFIQETMVELK